MKKKIVSMLLALALVVTGIPSGMTADTAYAAEVSEDGSVFSDAAEETGSVEESNEAIPETLHSEAGDFHAFNVAENGKAVGTDGVVYDDVVYLSADTVNALDETAQNEYIAFCDDVAAARKAGSDFNDVVAAVDENGKLVFYYTIPMQAVLAAMDEMEESFLESVETAQNAETEETETNGSPSETDVMQTEEEDAEKEVPTEGTEESIPEEMSAEEHSDEERFTEGSSNEQSFDEESATEEQNTAEEETAGENVSEEILTEEASGEESSTEEVLTEEISDEETETVAEESTEADLDAFVLTAENMELIPELEEEHFPVIENVKADVSIDLGYNNSRIQQINSILPTADHFKNQLTKDQQKIYDACKVMGKGTNTFKFNYSNRLWNDRKSLDLVQAVSAYIMTEPYKCDWMDLSPLTGGLGIKAYAYSESDPTYDYVVTIAKSKYYKASLNKEADARVLELVAKAQEYALSNYPASPVYGIVKYFDEWICENNFYEYTGVYGGNIDKKEIQETYYYCHSSYGILLKGYGVCESYALAMTRLLDAVGIPNMYATGDTPGGGHAWNYIQMPNGEWYLHDSTWNDDPDTEKTTGKYLLCGDDSDHTPVGNRWKDYVREFQFVKRSATGYKPESETITLSKTELNLLPKKTEELTYSSNYISNENTPKVWSSSNEKVAKVDKNGKVTAVGAGSAEITLTAAGMTSVCKVNVHQINSITFDDGGKASLTASGGIVSGSSKGETQHITLTVSQKAANPVYTAEKLEKDEVFEDFGVKVSDEKVAAVTSKISGNTIELDVTPKAPGKTKITVTFGTKKATLNFSVGEKLDKNWFELKDVEDYIKRGENGSLVYNGKAHKPKVILSPDGKEKKVKFKVTYKNNKDAGTASVIIAGTGAFGGEIKKDFIINPLVLKVDTDSIKVSEKGVYSGGANLTKSTVKHIDESGKKPKKVNLKAGKDYDILYTKKNVKTSQPTEAGEYTMVIVGKGNYAGGANEPVAIKDKDGKDKIWKIEQADIKKVKVSIKVNGTTPDITVAIGKNELPETDYQMTFYTNKNCSSESKYSGTVFAAKTQYYVKVEPAGSNVIMGAKSKPIIKSFKTK